MVVIGSDSHTCSSGALGCLAIGLGAADVTLPLVTGETWFRVPETVNVRLIGSPRPGIGGKDVILYILQQLKRNTVASERIVEFTGPGLQYLSSDARFAISNMTTVSEVHVYELMWTNDRKRNLVASPAFLFLMKPRTDLFRSVVSPGTKISPFILSPMKMPGMPQSVILISEMSSLF